MQTGLRFEEVDESRVGAFEMKCIRQILRVSWTHK